MLGQPLGARQRLRRGHRRRGGHEAQQQRGQLVQALSGRAGGGQHGHVGAEAPRPLRHRRPRPLRIDEVGLGQREHARQRGQAIVVGAQLALDQLEVGLRVGVRLAAQLWRDVEHVYEQAGALDVGEEVVSEAGAVAGPLDETGDVGDDELAVVRLQRAEHRLERGERVVGDLGRRARQPRDERGLARVGQADETDVGEELQLQRQPPLLPRPARVRRSAAPGAWPWRSACCRVPPIRRARRPPAGPGSPGRSGARQDRPPRRAPRSRAGRAAATARRRRRGSGDPRRAHRAGRDAARDGGSAAGRAASRRTPARHRRRVRRRRRRARPRGTCASRRKLRLPSPPAPACHLDSSAVIEHCRAIVTCPSIRKGPRTP